MTDSGDWQRTKTIKKLNTAVKLILTSFLWEQTKVVAMINIVHEQGLTCLYAIKIGRDQLQRVFVNISFITCSESKLLIGIILEIVTCRGGNNILHKDSFKNCHGTSIVYAV